jgi:dTDP-4-dehydrorhamnose reductase
LSNVKNILVTGANGQLGMEFRDLEKHFPGFHFLFATRQELPIEDIDAVTKYFAASDISYCINCAAYTAVDKAETEKDLAVAINTTAVGNLAAVCAIHNSWFIHFSTDYVFNGRSARPYKESDPTDPVNFYGLTKLEGEQAAINNYPASLIIRTSWVYSRHGKNFVKTMTRLFTEKEQISVVADQVGCPTYAADLAAAVMQIITKGELHPGIFHYANQGITSWHQFATAIKEITGSHCIVHPINSSQYPTPAARPAYSAFDTGKIQDVYKLEIKPWKESLAVMLQPA